MEWSDVLGVDTAASPRVVRAAYKALLRTAHPDAANGSRAALARVQRAYQLAIGAPTKEDEPRDFASQLRGIVADAVATVFDEAGCFVAHDEVASPRVLAAESGRRGRRLQVANGAPFEYYSPSALALYRELRGAAASRTHCPFASAHALALAIAAALPLRAYAHVQRCRAMAPGFLNFSVAHRSLTVSGGKVQCPICGDMCAVGRGMRQHLQSERHCLVGEPLRVALHAATAAAAAAPYSGATGADADAPSRGGSSQRYATVDDGGLDLGLLAARAGDLVALRAAAADGGSRWDARTAVDRNGSCALHYAAGGGHTALCAYLVDYLGVDVNMRVTTGRRDGRSALHWACRNGHRDTAQWLIAHGAEMRGTNDGTTPFHWAAWQGRRAVCEWIVSEYGVERARATNAFGCNAFHWAALQNDVAMCAFLHRLGVDATVRNHQGHTAVHKAAWRGAADVARWLRGSAGLPVGAFAQPDARGYRPADIARLAHHDELAVWLDAMGEVVEDSTRR